MAAGRPVEGATAGGEAGTGPESEQTGMNRNTGGNPMAGVNPNLNSNANANSNRHSSSGPGTPHTQSGPLDQNQNLVNTHPPVQSETALNAGVQSQDVPGMTVDLGTPRSANGGMSLQAGPSGSTEQVTAQFGVKENTPGAYCKSSQSLLAA